MSDWNTFRSKHKNKGLSQKEMSRKYQKSRYSTNDDSMDIPLSALITKPPKRVLRKMESPKIKELILSKGKSRSRTRSPLRSPQSRKSFRKSRGKANLYLRVDQSVDFSKPNNIIGFIMTKGTHKGTFYTVTDPLFSREKEKYIKVGSVPLEDIERYSRVVLAKEFLECVRAI